MRIDWERYEEAYRDGLIDEMDSLDLETGEFGMPKDGAEGRWVRVLEGVRASSTTDPFYDRERFERFKAGYG